MNIEPNILFIITDHHAWYNHFRPGEFELTFPAWERFCGEGVRFDRAYSVCPLCTPARTSMMTGVYPSRHGLRWNTENRRHDNRIDIPDEFPLYTSYLEQAGYRNGYVGKWHCGHARLPADYGLEGWSLPDYGQPYMSPEYKTYAAERGFGDARALIEHNLDHPDWAGRTMTLHDDSPWHFMNGSGILQGPPEAHEEFFVAHLAAEKLKDLSAGGRPWSLTASFWGPHQPYYPTEPFAGMVAPETIPEFPNFNDPLTGKPLRHFLHRDIVHNNPRRQWPEWSTWQQVVRRCYEQELQLDAAVGRLLDTLDVSGQAENTLVIWLADHGDALASHGGVWDKSSSCIEEVLRIPMAARFPGCAAAGTVTDRLVTNMDATATMLEAAGIELPGHMQSRSLVPVITDPGGAAWPDHVVCEHNGHSAGDIMQRTVVTDRYKYVGALFDGDELYDLEQDPYELTNLAADPGHRDTARQMRELLVAHIDASNDRPARPFLRYALAWEIG